MAMYGWTDGDMARHYTEAASRRRLSVEGSEFLLPAHMRNATSPSPVTRQSLTSRKPLK